MISVNNKVLAFETKPSRHKVEPGRNDKLIIAECWSLIAGQLNALLPPFFSRLDDDLFKMSEKAETNALGTLFFEAMRYLRIERRGLETRYLRDLADTYEQYWIQAAPVRTDDGEEEIDRGMAEFGLMEDGVLEESLAIRGMIEKGNNLYQVELFPLNLRFCSLLGEEREIDGLPIAPFAVCGRFENVLQSLSMDFKVKLFVYKIFDRQVLSRLGPIYHELNSHLALKGVMPSIARNIKRASAADGSAPGVAQHQTGDAVKDNVAYLDAFRFMQSLLDGWRNGTDAPGPSSPASAIKDAIIVESRDVLNALNSLQYADEDGTIGDEALKAEELKRCLAHHVEKLSGDNKARKLGRPEEDIIDMVGMIFDYILDDGNLSAPVKCLIARLQIPVIKVAILDKSFFSKKNHPARALLNSLAQAGIGLSAVEVGEDNPIMSKVEEIVGRVICEFDHDVGLFSELLDDFSSLMEKDTQRCMLAEERTRQVTQSKEKLWLAKKAVVSEITMRLQGKDTPASFRTFLYNDWKDVLVLAYLRRDKQVGQWERWLGVLDKLTWSVMPPADAQERLEVVRAIPALLKSIREGLEGISLDPHQIAVLLKDLEVCHMNSLRLSMPGGNKPRSGRGGESMKPSLTDDVTIRDEDVAEAISEMQSNSGLDRDVEVEEVVMGDADGQADSEAPGRNIDYAHGVFLGVVNRLKEGDWVEFIEEDKRPWRAKLSWKSQATSLSVFVNARGAKVMEIRANDLATRLREGRARVIEDMKTPLMDRALSYLMISLRNPFARTPATLPPSTH